MSTLKATGVRRCVWRQMRMAASRSASTSEGFRWPSALVNHDLHGRVFQLDQSLQGGVQGQVGKTTAGSGDKHGQTPFDRVRSGIADWLRQCGVQGCHCPRQSPGCNVGSRQCLSDRPRQALAMPVHPTHP